MICKSIIFFSKKKVHSIHRNNFKPIYNNQIEFRQQEHKQENIIDTQNERKEYPCVSLAEL